MSMFLTVAQFIYYNDENRVCELLSDDTDGEPIPVAQLTSNATLEEIINAAEQEVMSACAIGNRYTINDLVCLANDNNGGTVTLVAGDYVVTGGTTINGVGAKLRRLVAKVGWGELVQRKGFTGAEFAKQAPGMKQAMDDLEQLRLGERIFWSVTGTPEAGLPGVEVLGVNATFGQISQKVGLFGSIAVNNIWRGANGGYYPPEGWR